MLQFLILRSLVERQVLQVLKGQLVLKALRVQLEPLVLRVRLDLKAFKVLQALPALLELLELLEQQAGLVERLLSTYLIHPPAMLTLAQESWR